jgi:hypothetical protein
VVAADGTAAKRAARTRSGQEGCGFAYENRSSKVRRPMITARFLPSGDTALVVEFGDRMDRHLSALVLNLHRRLRSADIAGVVESVPTFRSLLVHASSKRG